MSSRTFEDPTTQPSGGLTRRRLLAGAGVGGAALVLGQGLRLSSSEAAVLTAVPGGYNEDWALLSDPLRNTPRVPASPTFAQRVRKAWDGYATYARTGVDWTTVRTTPIDRATSWASYDPMNAAFAAAGCDTGRGNFNRSGIRLLPVVSGCPPEFAESTQSGGPGWAYPRDEYLADFGHFVAETVKHFHQTHGNVTAVEIWNEPNLETFGAVPAGKLAGMINATRDAIVDYKARGQIPQDFTIVSGGLSLTARSVNGYRDGRPNLSPWETYLEDFMQRSRDHSAYHVGVHCYDLRENPQDATDVYTGVDMATAVMRAKQHMLQDQFDTFKTRTHTRQILGHRGRLLLAPTMGPSRTIASARRARQRLRDPRHLPSDDRLPPLPLPRPDIRTPNQLLLPIQRLQPRQHQQERLRQPPRQLDPRHHHQLRPL